MSFIKTLPFNFNLGAGLEGGFSLALKSSAVMPFSFSRSGSCSFGSGSAVEPKHHSFDQKRGFFVGIGFASGSGWVGLRIKCLDMNSGLSETRADLLGRMTLQQMRMLEKR